MSDFKVYQDSKTGNIVLSGSNYQSFYADDLFAEAEGDMVRIIRSLNNNRVLVGWKSYTEFKTQNGSNAGSTAALTVDYLNDVFSSDYKDSIRIDANQVDNLDVSDGLGFTGGGYDSATGVVTFTSNDGLGFSTGDLRGGLTLLDVNAAISTYLSSSSAAKEYAEFYTPTGGAANISNTAKTLILSNTRVNSDATVFSLSSDEVTINKSGDFKFSFDVYLNNSSTSRTEYAFYIERDSGTGYTEEISSRSASYQRGYDSGASGTINCILSVASGDSFRLRVIRTDGASSDGYQDDNGTRLIIEEK